MSIVLGINANHADSSACLIINGRLVAAIEEERINRKKHFSGFPFKSIEECLQIANVKDNNVTDVAFNTKPFSNIIPKSLFALKNLQISKKYSIERYKKKLKNKYNLFKKFNFKKNLKIHYIEHHLAHIASAYYPSNFKDAIGLSIDGSGDFVTLTLSECKDQKIKIKKKIFFPNSLGIFYHAMTQFLGFKNYGDEYKIMGMAAYGKPIYFDKIKDNLFLFDEQEYFKLNLKYFNHQMPDFKYIADNNLIIDNIYNKNLSELFSYEKKNSSNINLFTRNFASSVQKVYEYFFKVILKNVYKMNFSENLVFSGGCALNSSANRFLTNENKYFKNVYIPFAPGDNGGAIGAALAVSAKYVNKIDNLKSPYLGNKYSDQQVREILESKKYKDKIDSLLISNNDEMNLKAANLIIDGNVIGWFQDRMEFGPRALGNRSILADPRNPQMKDIINSKIKRRESFRPFAPSILQRYQNEWVDCKFGSYYMSTIGKVKKEKSNLVPAITHIDGSARFQTVNFEMNQKFYNLIEKFYKITGVPIVLNTSFNENEPIVMRPEEALDCLIRTDMDGIFLNNYFVKRKLNT